MRGVEESLSRRSATPVRHSVATRLPEGGHGLGTVHTLTPLGHRDARATMIHAHILNRGPGAVRSPADRLVEAPADCARSATGLSVLECYIAALAAYHRSCEDDRGREPAGSQLLGSDVEIGATWAGVARVVALHRPVQVSLGSAGR